MVCLVIDCGQPHRAKGLCQKHYYRIARGKSLDAKTRFDRRPAKVDGHRAFLPLGIAAKQGYAEIDPEDVELAKHNWTLGTRGYPTGHVDGKTVVLHHMIVGKPPKGLVVDHINRDKLDNRRSNLRFVTQQQNTLNKSVQSNNSTGHVGVTYLTKRRKWLAQISRNHSNKFLGHFDTLEEAVAARDAAALEAAKILT